MATVSFRKKALGKRARNIFIVCALIPAFALFILFNIVPTVKTFVDSLYGLNNEGENVYVGWMNYSVRSCSWRSRKLRLRRKQTG